MKFCRPTFWLSVTMLCAAIPLVRAGDAPKRIEIQAEKFTYKPNEITLKKGEPVILVLRSNDVTHGLKVPELNIKTADVKKEKDTEIPVTPDRVGDFTGKCAHFCGKGHGSMTLLIHVVP